MSNGYKKLFAQHYNCPICGKVDCKFYGSGKSAKHILRKRVRNKLKQLTQQEDKGQ